MHIDIDEKAHLQSVLHRMDIRFKIISLSVSALVISSCDTIIAAFLFAVYALMLTLFSGISVVFYLKKIYYPLLFLVPLFIFLPLSSGGNVLFSIFFISVYSKGLFISLLICLKVIAIIVLVNIMLNTAPFSDMASALKSLKVPDKMLNIILFTYRYFFVFFEDLRKMRVALTLRGFRNRSNIRSIRNSANLAGSILVRSYEQTERIYRAMLLRGYNGRIVSDKIFKTRLTDIILSMMIIAIPFIILYAETMGLFN